MENNETMENKILHSCTLILMGLLSFMFFPNTFEIQILFIMLGIFTVIFFKDKSPSLKKKKLPFGTIISGGVALLIYLFCMGISSYTKTIGVSFLRIIVLCIAAFAAFFIGNFMKKEEEYKVRFYDILFSFFILMLVISIFATLYSYGIFYVYQYPTVAYSAKMLIGFRIYEVERDALSYISVLALAPFSALLLYKGKKNHSFYILLASCIFGFIGLIISPSIVGLAIAICSIILTLFIRFFPKEKKKKIIFLSALGLVVLFGIILILLKGRQVARVRIILEVLKESFQYPLGMEYDKAQTILNGAMSSRNIFFDALYQGGWFAFLSLIVSWALIGVLLWKYYKKSKDDSFKKNLILGFFIHYFLYVNLNYTQNINADIGYILPYYLDPTFLIIVVLVGYIFQNVNQNSDENEKEVLEATETPQIEK